jgi:hypothetical protein
MMAKPIKDIMVKEAPLENTNGKATKANPANTHCAQYPFLLSISLMILETPSSP